jgi:DNA-binding Lrp family transcriptional regulator
MQELVAIEREAHQRLPLLLADLLGVPVDAVAFERERDDRLIDARAEIGRQSWVFEIKASSRPGIVDLAARQLHDLDAGGTIAVLVVPYMTPAGARAAAEHGLNWLDLSGNAHLRTGELYVHVEGRRNQFTTRGPTASPFAPKSSRIAHAMLLEPSTWWRQVDIAERLSLDDGYVSRIVRRLEEEQFLDRDGRQVRPRNPDLLLDAWADDYRFDRHDIVIGHATGSGIELARTLHSRLRTAAIDHTFTGLVSAWALSGYARFRLNTVYVDGNPRQAADAVELRRNERGANVQLVGPDDDGVYLGRRDVSALPCVSPVQTYLDLQHLPERADDAAQELRNAHKLWPDVA